MGACVPTHRVSASGEIPLLGSPTASFPPSRPLESAHSLNSLDVELVDRRTLMKAKVRLRRSQSPMLFPCCHAALLLRTKGMARPGS